MLQHFNNKPLLISLFFCYTLILALCLTTNVKAQTLDQVDPLKGIKLETLAEKILRWGLQIAVPITAIMTIWGAILLMTAMGDPRKIKQGQSALTWAVAGLVVIMVIQGLFEFGKTTLERVGSLTSLLNTIQRYLLLIGGPLSIVMYLYASFLLGTATPDNVKKGKNILIWTSVALAIISIFTVANLINLINQLAK